MARNLPISDMTTEEKIQTMEDLWDDLVRRAESIKSPDWHKQILNAREQGARDGSEEVLDWESTKKALKTNSE